MFLLAPLAAQLASAFGVAAQESITDTDAASDASVTGLSRVAGLLLLGPAKSEVKYCLTTHDTCQSQLIKTNVLNDNLG
jgi:hypothetical protein